MKTVIVPPGLGDSLWVLMKLINTGEKFDFVLPDSQPQRGKQIFDLLPQIANSCVYEKHLTYKKIEQASIHKITKLYSKIKRQEFCLSANAHLESGTRLEEFLPDLKISYRMEYHTSEQDKATAARMIPSDGNYFGIYASAYSNARNWNGWTPEKWHEYITCINKAIPGFKFVVIGASYDTDAADVLMEMLKSDTIQYVNTICQPLGVVIEILKKLHYFTGFPSGLSIINESLGKDGTMFYPQSVQKVANIMGTWADPDRIKNGNFKECLFPEPIKIAEWVLEEYKLGSKLPVKAPPKPPVTNQAPRPQQQKSNNQNGQKPR